MEPMSEPTGPSVSCTIQLEFPSPEIAEKIHRSVELDNEDYIVSRVDGRFIRAELHAESLKSLLHTLDDFLACTAVADNVVDRKD